MNASLDPTRLSDPAPVPPRALPHGTTIDRFEIVRVLADTGLGIEYLATDRQGESTGDVALQEYMPQRMARREGAAMQPRTASDADALARGLRAFVNEAQMLARVEHPSLVRVIDLIEANGTAYEVTPYRGGARLLHVRNGMSWAPDEPALRALLDGLLGALEALHRKGMLHGAVAPGNILLLADDHPLLLGPDLARAEITNDLVESLMAAVEPSFAAPEQRTPSTARPLGAWTDLYGLAETMRFCISGELPPPADSPPGRGRREPTAEMVQRLLGDTPTAHYSEALLETLDAALETSPAARPQSVAEFRAALGKPAPASSASDRHRIDNAPPDNVPPPAARPAPHNAAPPHVVIKTPRTRRRALWAGSALALLLAAGLFGWWWVNQPVQVDLPAPVSAPAAAEAPTLKPMPITEAAPPVVVAPSPSSPSASVPVPVPTPAPVPQPIAATPTPPARARVAPAAPVTATAQSPRDACAGRTLFSLYRCMQTQCAQRGWAHHPQCERLRSTDSVD